MSMSSRVLVVSAVFAFACSGAAFAANPQSSMAAPTKPHTAQQQRMIDCNHQATGKKGAERKTFMSACLKGHSPMATAMPMNKSMKMTQQQKMKSCNAEAKTKAIKGAARKSFMSSCLKGDASH